MDARRWAYDAFVYINRTYFSGELPWPDIRLQSAVEEPWLGWCDPVRLEAVVIHLHPLLLGTADEENPWRVPSDWLGKRWAFDVLLHETMHVRVAQLCRGRHRGRSPHDNDYWIEEVNRLAPQLGFKGLIAARPGRKLQRAATDPRRTRVPFTAAELFPYGYRRHTGSAASYYTASAPPF